jgi:hypothetical protein
MPDEKILREKAGAAIREGKLPSRRPDRTWGGPGVGAPCSVCGRPVSEGETEFEIQVTRDANNPGLDKFHVLRRLIELTAMTEQQLAIARAAPEAMLRAGGALFAVGWIVP